MEKQYDVVVFGATGFTGARVVEEVARTVDEEKGLKWAVAGRNMAKVQTVLGQARRATGKDLENLPIIIADVKSDQSLIDMCKQTKVLLNTVGPYRFFGDQVVRACIEAGTHHLDVSGEPYFLERMQLLYNAKAKEAGVYIIGACGFDSIPADLAVVFAKSQFEGDLNSVEGFLSFKTGPEGTKINFGTWQSAIYGVGTVSETAKQRKLLYASSMPRSQHPIKKRGSLSYAKEVESWCFPFLGSDKSIVYRTQRYFMEKGERPIQFNPYVQVSSLFTAIMIAFFGAIFGVLAMFSPGRWLLETFPGFFSAGFISKDGPSQKQIDGTTTSYTFIGKGYSTRLTDPSEKHTGAPDKEIVVKVNGPEPGYVLTPICMVQAAYTVLAEKEKIPECGVLTSGAALAKTTIIERLNKHNVTFKVAQK